MYEVKLPELGDGITKATIACFHFKVGDKVGKDDDIAELVTDKASFCVSAGCDGVIEEILYKEGQEANVGEVLVKVNSKKK